MSLYLSGDKAADELLSTDPFALIIGMVLDQQIPLERAFFAPYELRRRLDGKLDAKSIARMDPADLIAKFCEKPALHRFPAAMAERVQAVGQIVVDRYKSDAAEIWNSAQSGAELFANVRALPGFGEQKARIFIALLAKQLGVRPPGWEKVAGAFGAAGSHSSIADIDSPDALLQVREYKREMKAAAKSASHLPPKKPLAPRSATK